MSETERCKIACDLGAIADDERATHRGAAEITFRAVRGVDELGDGYALRLAPETRVIEAAGAFIARERRCCPFFRFALEVEPEGGAVRLAVTGREGVKAYIEQALLPQVAAATP